MPTYKQMRKISYDRRVKRRRQAEKNRPRESSDGTSGYVYVFNIYGSDLYKIGRTANDVNIRLKELRCGNPLLEINQFRRVIDMYQCEADLHTRYKKRRLEGTEFFELDKTHLDRIASYLDKKTAGYAKLHPEIDTSKIIP